MAEAVLAIDQGTTGTTAMVFDRRGRVLGRAYGEIRQFYPRPGWVEHDPEQLYRSVVRLGRQAIAASRVRPAGIGAVGITNQRETFVVWERQSGRPVHRAIVWQCRRSAAICAARGELCFGTIDSWLTFRLSRGAAFVTDFTNASRTMMLNLKDRRWDDAMLKMLGVSAAMLPEPVSSRGPLTEAAAGTFGPRAIPIGAVIGDQQSALYGQRAVSPGATKVTYGTGAFLLMHTGQRAIASRNRLLTTAALGPAGEPAYALEGSVFIAGAAVQWLRDELRIIGTSAESEKLARSSRDRSHPYLVPAFVGLGAPYWDAGARGAIVGITRGTNRADVVRAALDSIAYQVRDALAAMEKDSGRRVRELRVDGGATANGYLMQFQADVLGRPVRRPRMAETTALGAAMLAGLACGLWRSPAELRALGGSGRSFRPSMRPGERERLVNGWHAAVARVRSI